MGNKICNKCKESKTYPCFRFTGKKKNKSGKPGAYRTDICLSCEK